MGVCERVKFNRIANYNFLNAGGSSNGNKEFHNENLNLIKFYKAVTTAYDINRSLKGNIALSFV